MRELLIRLREIDPTTYERSFSWIKNAVWDAIKDNPEEYFLSDDPYPLRDALLQFVLQEAAKLNKWDYSVWNGGAVVIVGYREGDEPDAFIAYSTSEAEALLEAYTDAFERKLEYE